MRTRGKVFLILAIASFFIIGFCLNKAWAETKIAYVDLASVFDGYNKTKDYDVKLEATQKEKQEQIDKKVKEIKNMQDKLDLLSEKEKKNKQAEIDKKTKELQEFQRNAEISLKEERNEKLKEVLQDIQDVIEGLAKNNSYDFVLNDRVLLYGNKSLDITKQVLSELNGNYKKKKD